MNTVELFCMVSVPLYVVLFWLIRIFSLLERISENTEEEGEQK